MFKTFIIILLTLSIFSFKNCPSIAQILPQTGVETEKVKAMNNTSDNTDDEPIVPPNMRSNS